MLNRLRPSRAGDPLSGTLYVGALTREDNVSLLFGRKFKQAVRSLSYPRREASVTVRKGSATDLRPVPDGSFDYVFTDPPFGQNIFYADCSLLWESWLQDYTDEFLEIVCNERRVNGPFKTLEDYQALMALSFQEMHRVLKPGRWASVVFHNSDDRIWQAILDAAEAAGFELAEINAFDKVQLSFKGVRGQKGLERVTNQDIVLNLHKPRPGRAPAPNGNVVLGDVRVGESRSFVVVFAPPPDTPFGWYQGTIGLRGSNSDETFWEDVKKEAPDEFTAIKRQRPTAASVPIVFPRKFHFAAIHCYEAVVRYGHSVCITAKIIKYFLRAGEWWLCVYNPLSFAARCDEFGKSLLFRKISDFAVEL